MALDKMKIALEKRLAAFVPSIPIAYEGVHFDPPSGQLYLSCQLVVRTPDDPVFGTGYYREKLEFQIFVIDELGNGTGPALTKAEAIRNWFAKGTTLFEDSIPVHILRTPHVSGPGRTTDKVVIPVIIYALGEVLV